MAFTALPKPKKIEIAIEEEDEDAPASKPSPFASKIKTLGEMSPSALGDEPEGSVFDEHAGDIADLMSVPAEKRGEFISALKSAIEACHSGSYDDEE